MAENIEEKIFKVLEGRAKRQWIGITIGTLIFIAGFIITILGVVGSINWILKLPGFESRLINATPGVFFALLGACTLWIYKPTEKIDLEYLSILKSVLFNRLRRESQLMKMSEDKLDKDLKELVRKAESEVNKERPQKAIALMELEEDKFKNNPKFYKNLCSAYRAADDKKNALKYIKKAISLEPENLNWMISLGYTYWCFGNLKKAVEETEKAIKYASSKRDFLKIRNNLAYYYAQLEQKEVQAREYASYCYKNRKIVDLDPALRLEYINTHAYVKVKFAKEVDEVDRAISLYNNAMKEGYPVDKGISHLREAYLKRKELREKANN